MDYEETKKLEQNIKIKNEVDEVYQKFLDNISLKVKNYKDGRFIHWQDSHNAIYFALIDGEFVFQCRFLHEKYNVIINKKHLFKYIKEDYRGYGHFKVAVNSKS